MKKSLLPSFVKDSQNRVFARTRWRLATWYAGMMSLVIILCGSGVYHALIYAYRLTLIQELDLVANELHETLEPILEQPGKLSPAVTEVLPNLCLVNTQCLPKAQEIKHSSLPSQKYYIRLLDRQDNLIAVAGKWDKNLLNFDDSGRTLNSPFNASKALVVDPHADKSQKGDISSRTIRRMYNNKLSRDLVSVELETKYFQPWGFLQVGHYSSGYATYITNLRWIFAVSLPVLMIILIFISWWLAGRAMQPVRRSYQLLQQFTADAAHELRTPLAAIGATVESTLMMTAIAETDTRETLETIGRQNVRLSNLVADLLMLCRMDRQLSVASSFVKTGESVSLAALIEDIVEDFGSLALKSKIRLDTRLAISQPMFAIGDYEQLYRMVSNLVANALKYTAAGGRITLTLNCYGKYALIGVKDTGIGISSRELNKIFTRFYRIDSDRSRDTGGSGLGLSIAQAIAQAHQGIIRVESKLGRGSIFTVLLPVYGRTKL